MDQSKVFSQGEEAYPRGEKYIPKEEKCQVNQVMRENHGFRGRPSQHWMVVSIQASVSGFNWFQLISSD